MSFRKPFLRFAPFAALVLFAVAGSLSPVLAATSDSDKETIISAKQMHSDQATGIVSAIGKVEIARGGYVLHADKVTYNQKTGVMHAEGHVAMLTPSGDVQFADSEDVTGDMKQAYIQNLGILFPDNSRLAAKNAERYDGRYMVANTGVYTSCNVCKTDPTQPPLWQMRADKVVHDNVEHNIYYHNATLDFAGVPVFYTPYMSTPDPTVDRRQGFLSPQPGYTPTLGANLRTPYYFDISPDKDATFIPIYSQTDTLQVGGEYRERFNRGNLQLDGSVTHAQLFNDANVDEGKQWRGHLFGSLLYNIDNVWRAGSNVNFASDKTYLQRYNYGTPTELTTRNYVEGFSGRNYAAVNNYYFEDLRLGTQAVQPIVLPQANFSALGEPGSLWGGRWSLDGNTLVTLRDNANQSLWQQGPDTRRISLNSGWERRITSNSTGLVTTLNGLLHLDSYSADNVVDPTGNNQVYNKVLFARQFEQASAVTSYPMSRSGDGYQQLLEPMAGVTLAPPFYNSAKIPVEEGQDITFDVSNLFAPNRFTGYDLIEGGSRVTYGLRHMITTDSGGRVDMFGGQSYDFERNSAFSSITGLHDKASDYVGQINLVPTNWFTMNYGFRLDHKTLEPQREYAYISAGNSLFRPYARYSSGHSLTNQIIEKVDDASVGFDSHFAKYWGLHFEHVQGFDPQPGARSASFSISYADECYIFAISASQNYTQQLGGINPGSSVFFHMFLRNLGGIHTDSTTSATFPTEFRQTE